MGENEKRSFADTFEGQRNNLDQQPKNAAFSGLGKENLRPHAPLDKSAHAANNISAHAVNDINARADNDINARAGNDIKVSGTGDCNANPQLTSTGTAVVKSCDGLAGDPKERILSKDEKLERVRELRTWKWVFNDNQSSANNLLYQEEIERDIERGEACPKRMKMNPCRIGDVIYTHWKTSRNGNPLRAQVESLFTNTNKEDTDKDKTPPHDYYDISSTSVSENISTQSSKRGSGRLQ
eukprot:TRINITY_DN4900_c0_g1_i1.p1 TRINITY_DN4900_c0_g1~~TRINITY_DN4900_c0_g1_i1.p1  ORF type:complete len:239 (-),score=68.70 TRINITY_DN4900_c0_g1_i1:811-1527(-)